MPYYGFNFLWMFSWQSGRQPQEPDLRALDFLAEHGFNFVRVTTDYRFWTSDFDYFHPDERVFQYIDHYIDACRERGLHFSLNQHRAPGYCINANHLERHNLWQDPIAQDGFIFLWETFARRYKGIPGDQLDFDLLNEPPGLGQYGMTREIHKGIMMRAAAAIRKIDPDRPITIDGLGGGNLAMPELAGLDATHSGRGYVPMAISHYKASWWKDSANLPEPVYPGLEWNGKIWDIEALRENYEPWREVEAMGVPVHIGECGCYNKTPNDVAMRWFRDLFGLYKEFGWGFALWNFEGDFGIIKHGRPGAVYENYKGYQVDRPLLDLILESKV
jgi:endoglucanase